MSRGDGAVRNPTTKRPRKRRPKSAASETAVMTASDPSEAFSELDELLSLPSPHESASTPLSSLHSTS